MSPAAEGQASISIGYQLCFERATDVLSRLGVIEHYRGPVYRLCVGLEEIETGVAVASCEDLPPMDEIISAFLGVADHRALFPVNADAVFQVRETCEPALLALAEAGYAQHADGYFAWEEKIRRAMALQYFWPGMRAPARS